MLIQKLRLKNGWSQEQLATASGLSTRTIQRIEAGQAPSVESLKAIAGALDIEFTALTEEPKMTTESSRREEELEREAFQYVRHLRKFQTSLATYLVVVAGLWVVNLVTSPEYLWVLWVMGGWGIGVAISGFRLVQPDLIHGPEWERRQVEKRLGRPL